MTDSPEALDALREPLLAWFDAERRPMPWRDEATPYRVWISEIMLQQTQVVTATPYFERFTERFPDLASLAAAAEEEVLAQWSGLGYYRRARNLHRAARLLTSEHGGRLPRTRAELQRLPGVGRYTAGAVASIAFGEAEAALDGNGVRLLTRLFALDGDPARQPLKGELWRRLERLVDCERPGDVNEAVMEMGARICTPRNPACGSCPLAAGCAAREKGDPTRYPRLRRPEPALDLRVEVGLFRRDDALLLCRGSRPFLADLWNLPFRVTAGGGELPVESWRDLGLRVGPTRLLGEGEHRITRYRIRQELRSGRARVLAAEGRPEYRWVSAGERASLGLPAFSRKLMDAHGLGNCEREEDGREGG